MRGNGKKLVVVLCYCFLAIFKSLMYKLLYGSMLWARQGRAVWLESKGKVLFRVCNSIQCMSEKNDT
jgi:hypothetical protein